MCYEGARSGGCENWKCEASEASSLPEETKKPLHYEKKKESGQHAKVDALFANTAHMETPQLTFANLTFGLRPGKVL